MQLWRVWVLVACGENAEEAFSYIVQATNPEYARLEGLSDHYVGGRSGPVSAVMARPYFTSN